ncbi:Alpha-tocopherol transfer protein-like [Formica fusca]
MASIDLVPFEEELKRNPELKETDIKMLREWCEKQPHLPKISNSELALFLHSNYYRLESTKTTIDTFFTVRSHVPEFFCNRDLTNSKELKKVKQIVIQQILEGTTKDGYKIIYGRLLDERSEPSDFVYNDAIKLLNMVIDLWLYTQGTCNGHVILFDMKNVSFGYVGRLNPMGLKKFLYYLQEALPVRLKGFHFMNASPVIDVILNMMRPFMKKQLMDMLHMHTTNDTLEKFIPLEVLPNEAGGQAGPIQELHKKQIKKMEDHVAWFQEEEANHRVNEALRPGKAKTDTDLFGVEGSFKKLEID